MSIGNSQPYLDYMQRVDDERDSRDAQEIFRYMTEAERKEYEAWLDTLDTLKQEKDPTCEPHK